MHLKDKQSRGIYEPLLKMLDIMNWETDKITKENIFILNSHTSNPPQPLVVLY